MQFAYCEALVADYDHFCAGCHWDGLKCLDGTV